MPRRQLLCQKTAKLQLQLPECTDGKTQNTPSLILLNQGITLTHRDLLEQF